jgi:hypothetical protein
LWGQQVFLTPDLRLVAVKEYKLIAFWRINTWEQLSIFNLKKNQTHVVQESIFMFVFFLFVICTIEAQVPVVKTLNGSVSG